MLSNIENTYSEPLALFHENLGAVINEQGDKFHQDISVKEKWEWENQREWSSGMLAYYYSTFKQDLPEGKYSEKLKQFIVQ